MYFFQSGKIFFTRRRVEGIFSSLWARFGGLYIYLYARRAFAPIHAPFVGVTSAIPRSIYGVSVKKNLQM